MNSQGSGDPSGWNRFAYVGGDPVNFRDPRGLFRSREEVRSHYPDDENYCDRNPDDYWCRDEEPYDPGPPNPPGPGPDPPQKVTSASGALALLKLTINSLGPECTKVLPTADVLRMNADELSFFDARSSADGNKTIAQIAPALAAYNPTGTLQGIVGGDNAVTLYGASGSISSRVLLGNQFFLDDVYGNNKNFSVGQTAVLLHELLHYAAQRGDDQFVSAYGISRQQYESSSSAINRWLQNDCKN
jgi:hypothetical protein